MPDPTTVKVDGDTAEMLDRIGENRSAAVRRIAQASQQPRKTRNLVFDPPPSANVVNSDGQLKSGKFIRLVEDSPITGRIVQVMANFRAGANDLIGITVDQENETIVPSNGGELVLDDSSPPLPANEPVQAGGNIAVEMNNRDNTNAHKVTVILTVIGEPLEAF